MDVSSSYRPNISHAAIEDVERRHFHGRQSGTARGRFGDKNVGVRCRADALRRALDRGESVSSDELESVGTVPDARLLVQRNRELLDRQQSRGLMPLGRLLRTL